MTETEKKERRLHLKSLRDKVRGHRLTCNPQTPFLKGSVDKKNNNK